MIAILDNLISVLTLQVGFTLGDIIHVLNTPAGAAMAVSLLVYLEYVNIKSITKDIRSVITLNI